MFTPVFVLTLTGNVHTSTLDVYVYSGYSANMYSTYTCCLHLVHTFKEFTCQSS